MNKKLFVLFIVLVLAVSLTFLFRYDKKALTEEKKNETEENILQTDTEDDGYDEDVLGVLQIDKINLNGVVKEGSSSDILKDYIGRKKEKEIIKSYRHHKNFEMITMEGYNDINEVLKYKGLYVYIKKEDLKLRDDEYLESDMIGLNVYVDGKLVGKVKNIYDSGNNKVMTIHVDNKDVYIPYQKEFISNVDIKNKKIVVTPIKGMFE